MQEKKLYRNLFWINLQAFMPATLIKRDSNTDAFCFLVNVLKLLWTPCLEDASGRVLLFFGDRKSHFRPQNLEKYTSLLYFYCFFFSFLHVILRCKIISWFWNQKLWFQVHVIASIHCVKVSKYGVISGPYFPVFSPNTEKYGPEITPYMDTFHVVLCVNMN